MPNFAAAGSVATKLGISSVYSYFEQMGAKPGEEFSEAIHLCDKQGIPLICGDRKIEDTVNELQSALFEDLPSILGDDGRRYKDIGERDDDMDEIKKDVFVNGPIIGFSVQIKRTPGPLPPSPSRKMCEGGVP